MINMPEKIIITADSTCDLSKELIQKHNIKISPLYVIIGDNALKDGEQVTPDDIYKFFDEKGEVAKTSAVSVDDYKNFFTPLVEDGYTVIHFNISLGFSSCYQNAVIAANELENVFPVDSKNLSTGIGLLVLKAAELAESGVSSQEILKIISETVDLVEASFVIDTLTYLHKGGRCSTVAKLGANLLKLKPCIEVKDGLMHVGKKFRGNYINCIKEYINLRLSNRNDIDKSRIFITHTRCSDEVINTAKKEVAKYGFDEILETTAGCTVTSHCGPNTLGILFINKPNE